MSFTLPQVLAAFGESHELTLSELRDRITSLTGHRPQVARLTVLLNEHQIPTQSTPTSSAGITGPNRISYLRGDVQNAVDDLPPLAVSARSPRVTCQLRLPAEIVSWVEKAALARGSRLSDVVLDALKQYREAQL
jgi:hypothetical protein